MAAVKLKLTEKKNETADVVTFLFEPSQPDFSWKAGQYLRYHLENPQSDDRGQNRYFTIASAPYQKMVQITTRINQERSSTFKTQLTNLSPGEEVEAVGPLGSFTLDDPQQSYVFIAGGIGITPFHSIILDLNHQNLPINITLLYANRTEEVVFKEELEKISSTHPEFKTNYFIGETKIDGPAIKHLVPNLQLPFFYISGPEPMMESFVGILTEMGVPEEHIKHDYFPGYTNL